jgi:hypothetical protein
VRRPLGSSLYFRFKKTATFLADPGEWIIRLDRFQNRRGKRGEDITAFCWRVLYDPLNEPAKNRFLSLPLSLFLLVGVFDGNLLRP